MLHLFSVSIGKNNKEQRESKREEEREKASFRV